MKTYLDANALVRYYLDLPGREVVANHFRDQQAAIAWPLPITDLLRFEVTNAFEQMVFASRHGKQIAVSPQMALAAQADFAQDLASGAQFKSVALTLADLEREFDALVRKYTAKHGFRTYDILHVSSALTLDCRCFVSFDIKANTLAKLIGLETIASSTPL